MTKSIPPKIIALVFGILVLCFSISFYIFAWTEPSANPPQGNVDVPLNVSGTPQGKLGNLGVGIDSPVSRLHIKDGQTWGSDLSIEATGGRRWMFISTNGNATEDAGKFLIKDNTAGAGVRLTIDTSGNVGIGTAGPGAKLHINDGAFNYKIKYIGTPGGDYIKSVIVLHEAYNATLLNDNYAIGKIFASRGNTGAYNRKEVAEINTGSAYNGTNGNLTSISSDSLKWKLVTFTYNGIKYLGVDIPYTAAMLSIYGFEGYHNSTAANSLTIVNYYNVQTGTAINTEINNSIADFTSYGQQYVDATTFSVSGSVGIGTAGPGAKLEVAGQVKITGGTPGAGKVLTSDAAGLATWVTPASGLPSGTSGQTLRHDGTSWVANSVIFNNGTNVGIGTASPGQKLTIAGGHAQFDAGYGPYWAANTDAGFVRFYSTGDGAGQSYLQIGTEDNSDEPIIFTQTGNERMRIHTNGNVGIGTAGPGYKLDVSGDMRASNFYSNNANPYLNFSSYFVAPGGAYFNSGTVYTEAAIQARGGISNDSGNGGGNVYFNEDTRINGAITCLGYGNGNQYCPSNGAIRLTPNLHLNSNAGYAVILNWDNGTTGATQTLRVGNGASADAFYVRADGYVWAASSMRATSYYDDDPNYYIDSNSASYVNRILTAGRASDWGATGEIEANYLVANAGIYSYGGICSGTPSGDCNSGGQITAAGTIYGMANVYGTIFYDYDNSNYYVDPSFVSHMNTIKYENVSNFSCTSSTVGSFIYNRDAGQFGSMYLCRQDTGTGYSWVNIVQQAGVPDVSEFVRVDDLSIEAGDIVGVSDTPYDEENAYNRFLVEKATNGNSSKVLGIVSTDKSLVLNQPSDPSETIDYTSLRPLSLAGRVPVKVTSENGPIKKGDPLTVSSIPGVATRATKAGYIIGKALETYDNPNSQVVNKILVLVSTSWYDPDVYLTSTGELNVSQDKEGNYLLTNKDNNLINRIGAFGELAVAKIKAGVIETKKLIIDGVDILKRLNDLTEKTENQQKEIDQLKAEIKALETKVK